MKDFQHFNFDFDGLDESVFMRHSEHRVLTHEAKFFAWLGFDPKNKARIEADHLQPGDVVRGVFRPMRGVSTGGRKADALTIRGVRRILLRSNHPRAIEYADRVLDVLDELATKGVVVDEKNITDDQVADVQGRLEALQAKRIAERMDYRHVQHALKQGGAISDDYRIVQNTLYIELFGMTATAIRATQEQLTGDQLKDGSGFTKASKGIAKNYLTEAQLNLLNNTVLAMFVQINQHYPNGANVQQMLTAVHRAVALTRPSAVAA